MSDFFSKPTTTVTPTQAISSGSAAGLFNTAGTGAFADVTSGTSIPSSSASSTTLANLEAFNKGLGVLGALGALASTGVAIAAAVKGTKKQKDPRRRQQELASRLIAQRAEQRGGGLGSTKLTGPLGDLSIAPTGKRTLLGS